MSAIKKFFENRKLNRKFKKAGPGNLLTSSSSPTATAAAYQPSASPRQVSAAKPPSDGQKRAAEAAVARATRPETGQPKQVDCIDYIMEIKARKVILNFPLLRLGVI